MEKPGLYEAFALNCIEMASSLLNFNPHSPSDPVLDSPRSLQACKAQGIQPQELLIQSLEACRKKLPNYPDDLVRVYYNALEERRKMKLELVLEERAKILSSSTEKSPDLQGKLQSPRQTAEAKALETVRRKQELEVRQAMETQRLMEERRAKNRLKEEAAARRDAERRQELAAARAEQEQKRLAEEERKREIEQAERLRSKQLRDQDYSSEQAKASQQRLLAQQRKREALRLAQEREAARLLFEQSTKDKLAQQAQRVATHRETLQQREEERKQLLEMQKLKKKQLSQAKKTAKEQRLQAAQGNLAAMLTSQREQLEERQRAAWAKLQQFQQTLEHERSLSRKVRAISSVQRPNSGKLTRCCRPMGLLWTSAGLCIWRKWRRAINACFSWNIEKHRRGKTRKSGKNKGKICD